MNVLGDYLTARRQQVDPARSAVIRSTRRRAPGLRREEVAALAGISSDYYARLEQGRDRNPSPRVLASLATVFNLDATATDYLLGLVGSAQTHSPSTPSAQVISEAVVALLHSLQLPAFVMNRTFDIVATNPRAPVLSSSFRTGANHLVSMFFDIGLRESHHDWDTVAAHLVAGFRRSVGVYLLDAHVVALVERLSRDPTFTRLWHRHDVADPGSVWTTINYPGQGRLELCCSEYVIDGSGGLLLVVYHAAASSPSARALDLLAATRLASNGGSPTAAREGRDS